MASQSGVSQGGCELTVGTRNQIRAIRNASELEVGCNYAVTGYARGCLTAGIVTQIVLTATDVNEFSFDVDVNTTFDNTAWRGTYDLDTNRITSLEDNLGNRVYGQTGVEVDRFPWGNANFRENVVDHADVFVDCATAFRSYNNRFENDAQVELRGATGYIYNSTFGNDAIVDFDNATGVAIQALNVESRGRIYAVGASNILIFYHTHQSEAYWIFNGQTDIRAYYSTFGSTTRIYYTGGTRHWFYYSTIQSYGVIRQLSGDFRMYYTSLLSYAEIRNEAGSGRFYIYGSTYNSRSYIRNYNTNYVRHYYVTFNSSGRANHRDAASQTLQYSNIGDLSTLNAQGTSTTIYALNMSSQSTFAANGGNHYRVTLDTRARLTTSFNTRQVYLRGNIAKLLTVANSNRGCDYFNDTLV